MKPSKALAADRDKLLAARAGGRQGLAEALVEIRNRTRALPKARFENRVTEAVAHARKSR